MDAVEIDTETTRDVVTRAYEAGKAGDLAAFAALMADNILMQEPVSHPAIEDGDSGEFAGRDDVVAALDRVMGVIGLRGLEVRQIAVEGELAIAIVDLTCTSKSGESFPVTLAEAWWVRDGKIQEVRPYYFDVNALADKVTA